MATVTNRTCSKMTDSVIDQIKASMLEKGISGPRLSELSGVSMQNMYRILRKEQSPTLDKLVQLTNALGLSIKLVSQDEAKVAG